MRRHDWIGLAAVLMVGVVCRVYRSLWIEPPAIELSCLHGGPSLMCGVRAGLNWLIHDYLLGTAALACGIFAMASGRFAPALAATCLGVVAAENYNFSWGLLAAALGLWTWLRAPAPPGLAA